jgi:hypothetical protein
MKVKFSVGVTKGQQDRLLLEERRRSPNWLGLDADETRACGWPAPPSADEDIESQAVSHWAW